MQRVRFLHSYLITTTTCPAIPFDLEKATALLKEAGWEDRDGNGIVEREVDGQMVEFEFTLTIFGSSKEYKTIGDILRRGSCKDRNQNERQPTEWSLFIEKTNSKEFDAVTLAWVSGPDVDFRQIWHSSQADVPQSSDTSHLRMKKQTKSSRRWKLN